MGASEIAFYNSGLLVAKVDRPECICYMLLRHFVMNEANGIDTDKRDRNTYKLTKGL